MTQLHEIRGKGMYTGKNKPVQVREEDAPVPMRNVWRKLIAADSAMVSAQQDYRRGSDYVTHEAVVTARNEYGRLTLLWARTCRRCGYTNPLNGSTLTIHLT